MWGSIFGVIAGLIPEATVAAVVIWLISWAARKWLKPWLQAEKRKSMAIWIASIADDITDGLVAQYPNARWDDYLNDGVDALIKATGIEKDVAERASKAALGRKGQKNGAG